MNDRYQRIADMEADHSTKELCQAFAVSRSGYYEWRQREPSARQQANARLVQEMKLLRQGEEACYGSPRMTEELLARGHTYSENRVARLMRTHGLRAQATPRFVPRTTDSDQPAHRAHSAGRTSHARRTEPNLAARHHLCSHRAGLVLPGAGAGSVESQDRRLGHGRSTAQRTGRERAPDGPEATPTQTRFVGAFGSRRANTPARKPGRSSNSTAGSPA